MSPQNPRPVPRAELSARRRNSILLAIGLGLATLLCFFLALLLLRSRRQRTEPQEPQEAADDDAQAPQVAAAKGAGYLNESKEELTTAGRADD